MTEFELRERVADRARAWLGLREADGGHKAIIDVYNSYSPHPRGYALRYTDAWCAGFVSAVAIALGLGDVLPPECSCPVMIARFQALGRWAEDDGYTPQAGDVIFYDWEDTGAGDNAGASDHVGLVVSCDGESVTVIEGNAGDAVAERKLAVNGRYIRGYGVPDYASVAPYADAWLGGTSGDAEEAAEDADPGEAEGLALRRGDAGDAVAYVTPDKPGVAVPTCPVTLPELRVGDTGAAVKAMQTLLIAKHFSCGGDGADGDFGPATAQALANFQTASQLTVDRICGAKTWAALIGG